MTLEPTDEQRVRRAWISSGLALLAGPATLAMVALVSSADGNDLILPVVVIGAVVHLFWVAVALRNGAKARPYGGGWAFTAAIVAALLSVPAMLLDFGMVLGGLLGAGGGGKC